MKKKNKAELLYCDKILILNENVDFKITKHNIMKIIDVFRLINETDKNEVFLNIEEFDLLINCNYSYYKLDNGTKNIIYKNKVIYRNDALCLLRKLEEYKDD